MHSEGEKTSKKPYESPDLIIYGDIRVITQTVLLTGNFDDALLIIKTS